jgi:hypothetical protein
MENRVSSRVQQVTGSGCSGSLFRVARIGDCIGSTGRWLTGDRVAGVLWSRRHHPSEDWVPSPSTLPISLSISRLSLGLISLVSTLSDLPLNLSISLPRLSLCVWVEHRRRKKNRRKRRKKSWTAVHRRGKREQGEVRKEKEK